MFSLKINLFFTFLVLICIGGDNKKCKYNLINPILSEILRVQYLVVEGCTTDAECESSLCSFAFCQSISSFNGKTWVNSGICICPPLVRGIKRIVGDESNERRPSSSLSGQRNTATNSGNEWWNQD